MSATWRRHMRALRQTHARTTATKAKAAADAHKTAKHDDDSDSELSDDAPPPPPMPPAQTPADEPEEAPELIEEDVDEPHDVEAVAQDVHDAPAPVPSPSAWQNPVPASADHLIVALQSAADQVDASCELLLRQFELKAMDALRNGLRRLHVHWPDHRTGSTPAQPETAHSALEAPRRTPRLATKQGGYARQPRSSPGSARLPQSVADLGSGGWGEPDVDAAVERRIAVLLGSRPSAAQRRTPLQPAIAASPAPPARQQQQRPHSGAVAQPRGARSDAEPQEHRTAPHSDAGLVSELPPPDRTLPQASELPARLVGRSLEQVHIEASLPAADYRSIASAQSSPSDQQQDAPETAARQARSERKPKKSPTTTRSRRRKQQTSHTPSAQSWSDSLRAL